MPEYVVVIINALVYITLFIFFLIRYGISRISSVLSGLYALNALLGVFLYSFPLYDITPTSLGHITIEASLYLAILHFIIFYAFRNYSLENLTNVEGYDYKFLTTIQVFLACLITIFVIFLFPSAIQTYFSGNELADLRNDSEQYGLKSDFIGIFLLQRVFGSTSIILLFISLFNVIVIHKRRKIDFYGILLYIMYKVMFVIGAISRASVVFFLFELLSIFILFLPFMTKKVKKKIIIYCFVLTPLFFTVFQSITKSRFDDSDKYGYILGFSTLRYGGESQLNFMGLEYPDLQEPFCGFSSLPIFRRCFFLDYDDGQERYNHIYNDYISRIYHYEHPTYIFHTAIGSLFFDWGKYLTALIICFIAVKLNIKKEPLRLSYMRLFMCFFFCQFFAKGIFYADYCNEAGNCLILFLFGIHYYLKTHGKAITIKQKNV